MKGGIFMNDIEFQLDNFMLYCSSKNLSRKTLSSYEQTMKVQSGHISLIKETKMVLNNVLMQFNLIYVKYAKYRDLKF